ncbi:hypothetical protein Emed_002471 [Eimeria media]
MEDCGESSSEAPGDKASCWMKRRIREQQSQHEDGLDLHSLTDERAKALLEYRARCTSARFWIQSELLDLHVGCSDPSQPAGGESQQAVHGGVAEQDSARGASDPGLVGDLPSLMRRHLTCPLLSKLLQQDPVLSGKLATLDHVLWHRRSKHEPQTSGWMSHDPLCPDSYPLGVPGIPQGTAEALAAADAAGASSSSASLRSETKDSAGGAETSSSAPNKDLSRHTETDKEGDRPVTVWVSCERCMEHFAYIAASLLVFLKPSELRDLAVERQQSNCCGFVFCGRRNVATPEKRRTALWRWTLDLGGSRVLSEDELVQFCCSRCCNRQQQLLRLLDEEPMYARPGIKEWIGDALQRKAAYRPHPHLLTEEEEARGKEASSCSQQQGERASRPSAPTAASATGLPDKPQLNDVGPRPPVEMDVLLSEGPERVKAQRLVGPLLEKPPSCVSFSTESSSGELARLEVGQSMDGYRLPLTIEEDESSGDEERAVDTKKGGDSHISGAVGKDRERFHSSVAGGQSTKASNSFLMLNYGSGEVPSDPNGMSPPTSGRASSDSPPSAAASAAEAARKTEVTSSSSSKGLAACAASGSPASSKGDEAGGTQLKPQEQQQQQQQQQQSKQDPSSAPSQSEPPIKSRGSRVRFADDDGEDAEDGEGDGDPVSASLFKHFFNMQDEDDGLGFYHRADRLAAAGGASAGGQPRNGTGELRSILKPATEPVDPSPSHASSTAESQVGYMRLSDVVIAFDLLSSCCTEASAAFLAGYHRQFCTCSCEGAVPTGAASGEQQTETDDSPKSAAKGADGGGRGIHLRKDAEADESDSVSCVDGESGDEIEPVDLWRRRQQQLLKAILRSLPPSADNFAPLVTELCETFRPLQPLPTLRCSLCSCLAAVILLLLLLLRARPLTCCCCCESCRPWSNSHERHSRCQRRPSSSGVSEKGGNPGVEDAAASIYFDDALTLAKEEDVGLALVDFVRSTIHQSAPCANPHRPVCGGTDASTNAADAAEVASPPHEEKAIHVLLESIFSRMTLPIVQMCSAPSAPH